MKKKILMIMAGLLLMVAALGGCSGEVEENRAEETVKVKEALGLKVGAPSGAPTLSLIKMFEEKPSLGENVEVEYESIAATDALSAKLLSEELDMAVVPTNLASSLYNKGLPYKLVGSNVWGLFYLTSTEGVDSWEDLRGKEIYTIGRGLTPDIVFRYLLEQNGIDPEIDVSFNYMAGATELSATIVSGEGSIALIPEPMLSKVLSKRQDMSVGLDIQEEWSKVTGQEGGYPQTSLIVKEDVLKNHPDIVEAFVKAHIESIDWANENPSEAGIYSEKIQPSVDADTVEKGIERVNMKYVGAAEAKESIESYLKVLLDYSPDSIGGKIPDEDFYYEK